MNDSRWWLGIVLLLASCGGKSVSAGGTDTSTNWVVSCGSQSDCSSEVSCRCSICTSECEIDEDCEGLHPDAVCEDSPDCSVSKLCVPPDFEFDDLGPAQPGGNAGSPPAECRSHCGEGSCSEPEPSLEQQPTIEELHTTWDSLGCGRVYARGECAGGVQFLYRHTGFTSETRYFNAEGDPLGQAGTTDDSDPTCGGRFYWPEPIICEDGVVSEVYCRDSLDTIRLPWADGTSRGPEVELPSEITPPARCLSQCELAGACEQLAFEDYPSFEETRTAWSAEGECLENTPPGECDSCALTVLEGQCEDGTRFLHTHDGTVGQLHYFDSDGVFIGLTTSTDDIDQLCLGQSYWPMVVECQNPIVTMTLCGQFPEQASISLPWADYRPVDSPYSLSED